MNFSSKKTSHQFIGLWKFRNLLLIIFTKHENYKTEYIYIYIYIIYLNAIKVLIIHYDDILKIYHYFITYIKIHFYFKCFIKYIKSVTPPSKGLQSRLVWVWKTFKTFPDKWFLTTSKLLLCWCIRFKKKVISSHIFFSEVNFFGSTPCLLCEMGYYLNSICKSFQTSKFS